MSNMNVHKETSLTSFVNSLTECITNTTQAGIRFLYTTDSRKNEIFESGN